MKKLPFAILLFFFCPTVCLAKTQFQLKGQIEKINDSADSIELVFTGEVSFPVPVGIPAIDVAQMKLATWKAEQVPIRFPKIAADRLPMRYNMASLEQTDDASRPKLVELILSDYARQQKILNRLFKNKNKVSMGLDNPKLSFQNGGQLEAIDATFIWFDKLNQ